MAYIVPAGCRGDRPARPLSSRIGREGVGQGPFSEESCAVFAKGAGDLVRLENGTKAAGDVIARLLNK